MLRRQTIRLLTTTLLFIGLGLALSSAYAQSTQPPVPIIASDNHALYAINPDTGDTRLLVQLGAAQIQTLDDASFHTDFAFDIDRSVLCCLSPNGRYIAYMRPIFELIPVINRLEGLYDFPNNIEVIEPANVGAEPLNISRQTSDVDTLLNAGKALSYKYGVWSTDSNGLYALEQQLDLRAKRILSKRIVYIDMTTGQLHNFVRLNPNDIIDGLFPLETGLFVREYTDAGYGYHSYRTYNLNGEVVAVLNINQTDNAELTGYYDSHDNPIRTDEGYQYALSKSSDCRLAVLVQPLTATPKLTTECHEIATVSHFAPATSLRSSFVRSPSIGYDLAITDANNMRVHTIDGMVPWGYALSPDGHSVAYVNAYSLNASSLFIWHSGQTVQFDIPYPITTIVWAPLDYIPLTIETK